MDIKIEDLTIAYGDAVAVKELNLTIDDGEFLVLLGPSGCGKTTTMRCIGGLEQAASGRITVGGRVVADASRGLHVPANKRNIGMVFQSYAIWPHMTVEQNVGYSLKIRRVPKDELRRRVGETLDLVGLSGLGSRGASKLSGGQMQRVALARSLVMQPNVLLLDEPLSNLDAKLRDHLRLELKAIQREAGVTSIFVTHDQREALALADRIAIMREGRIVQLDVPRSMYLGPSSPFVADFLGATNIFPGAVSAKVKDGVEVGLDNGSSVVGKTSEGKLPGVGDQVIVAIRPESVVLERASGTPGPNRWLGTVQVGSFLGTTVLYRVQLENGVILEVADTQAKEEFPAGTPVTAVMNPDSVVVLDTAA
ncbi:MAG: ABC transporter ATP-binding protein [Cryobacterium sp.]|nr:ABC transporter ATP-binding protein [Cryobacterium sp.]